MATSGTLVAVVAATLGRSFNNRAAALLAVRSLPLYICADAQLLIASCILHCVASRSTECGSACITLSKRDTPSPCSVASGLRTVGGNCCGSPTRTARRARRSGSHEFGWVACAASSTRTRSKGGSFLTRGSEAPVVVQSNTCASATASKSPRAKRFSTTRRILRRTNPLICDFRCAFIVVLCEISFNSRCSSSAASAFSSLHRRSANFSGVTSRFLTSKRSGLPTRTSRSCVSSLFSRSTRLSTAMFDGAHTSSRSPFATACRTISTMHAVLPDPGGPCTITSGCACSRAAATACRWYTSSVLSKNSPTVTSSMALLLPLLAAAASPPRLP
mmetsp:Transcript_22105/g.36546  ORF Transcript_22105/g.36546 Transcript_22105/m.36546 type:complete len:332 (+) Transcript_22105:784-1779(+)